MTRAEYIPPGGTSTQEVEVAPSLQPTFNIGCPVTGEIQYLSATKTHTGGGDEFNVLRVPFGYIAKIHACTWIYTGTLTNVRILFRIDSSDGAESQYFSENYPITSQRNQEWGSWQGASTPPVPIQKPVYVAERCTLVCEQVNTTNTDTTNTQVIVEFIPIVREAKFGKFARTA